MPLKFQAVKYYARYKKREMVDEYKGIVNYMVDIGQVLLEDCIVRQAYKTNNCANGFYVIEFF